MVIKMWPDQWIILEAISVREAFKQSLLDAIIVGICTDHYAAQVGIRDFMLTHADLEFPALIESIDDEIAHTGSLDIDEICLDDVYVQELNHALRFGYANQAGGMQEHASIALADAESRITRGVNFEDVRRKRFPGESMSAAVLSVARDLKYAKDEKPTLDYLANHPVCALRFFDHIRASIDLRFDDQDHAKKVMERFGTIKHNPEDLDLLAQYWQSFSLDGLP